MLVTETHSGNAFLARLQELKASGRVPLRMKWGKRNGEWEFVHDEAARYNQPVEKQAEFFSADQR